MTTVKEMYAGKKVGVCVSGGLDSKTVCKRLTEDGINVLAFSADLGQPDEDDIQNVQRRMATCNVDTVIVDLKVSCVLACPCVRSEAVGRSPESVAACMCMCARSRRARAARESRP